MKPIQTVGVRVFVGGREITKDELTGWPTSSMLLSKPAEPDFRLTVHDAGLLAACGISTKTARKRKRANG
jgi:hypothetical protein